MLADRIEELASKQDAAQHDLCRKVYDRERLAMLAELEIRLKEQGS
jgi:hypothetical protein